MAILLGQLRNHSADACGKFLAGIVDVLRVARNVVRVQFLEGALRK